MAIDRSGEWWTGESFDDLAEYITLLTSQGYPADEIKQSVCVCGGTAFELLSDQDEGCAQRICVACGISQFIGDSAEYWEEVKPKGLVCTVCKGKSFEIGVGFSLRKGNDDVKWITVGERCVACGTLGSYVDWGVNYGPSDHLRSQV
jgi:hypothetical protein